MASLTDEYLIVAVRLGQHILHGIVVNWQIYIDIQVRQFRNPKQLVPECWL
jgi:hypothetical protein